MCDCTVVDNLSVCIQCVRASATCGMSVTIQLLRMQSFFFFFFRVQHYALQFVTQILARAGHSRMRHGNASGGDDKDHRQITTCP